MSKYENYYPTTTCFQDKETSLSKKDSMCEYCYSCYLELCETISNEFDIPIKNNGILKHNCLEYLCEKVRDKLNKEEYTKKQYYKLRDSIENIVNILNKYTNYSNNEKEGYNLLHISFVECLMKPLDIIIHKYYAIEETELSMHFVDKNLKKCALYNINILCLDVYCYYQYNSEGLLRSMGRLYALVKKDIQ